MGKAVQGGFLAAWVVALTGLAEPIGAVIGSLLTTGFALLYPVMMMLDTALA